MHMRSPIRRVLSLLAVAAVAVAACRNGGQAAELPATPTPGTYSLALRSGGFDRMAHVHIPKGYQAGTKPPLVLALHGAGGDGLHMLNAYHWTTKADREGFLVVAPTGLPALPRLPASFQANPHVWNSGQLGPLSPRAKIDDVAFVGPTARRAERAAALR